MANLDPSASLFGPSPEQVQQQGLQNQNNFALQYAQMDPFTAAKYSIGSGVQSLGRGLFGLQDPNVIKAQQTQQALAGVDTNDPSALLQAAVAMRAIDPARAAEIAAQARDIQQKQAETKYKLAQAAYEQKRADAEANPYAKLDPKDWTSESWAKYLQTKNGVDLVRYEKPQYDATPADIQGYQLSQSQGFKGTFTDWLKLKSQQIHINTGNIDRSNYANIQPDGKGGWIGLNKQTQRMEQIPVNEGVVGKEAAAGGMGGREGAQISRVIMAGNQASKDLENVTKLPMSASRGIFGGRGQGPSMMSAGAESLTNQMTSQEVQTYNTVATGFQRSLAAIEAAGLMPNGTLTHQMDAVIFKEGDYNLTKLQKLAQIRQIVDAGLETTDANPRVPPELKKHIAVIRKRLEDSVPFTQSDLFALQAEHQINPKATLKSTMQKMKASVLTQASAPTVATPGTVLRFDAQGNPL
jgi:hypothetical protein